MTTWKISIHLQTPTPGHLLHHFRRIKIPNLKSCQLLVDGDYHFQNDLSNNLPSNKPSLHYSNVYLPKSDFSSGNIISVAACCILFDRTSENGEDPTKKLSGFYAANLAISVHAVIIVGDLLLVGLQATALHPRTTGPITTRTPSGDLIREELILCRFYKRAEECEYFYLCSESAN